MYTRRINTERGIVWVWDCDGDIGNPTRSLFFCLLEDGKRLLRLAHEVEAHYYLFVTSQQVSNGTLFNQVALLHNCYAITDLLYLIQHMARDEDGFSQRRQALDQLANFKHPRRIESVSGLVQHH